MSEIDLWADEEELAPIPEVNKKLGAKDAYIQITNKQIQIVTLFDLRRVKPFKDIPKLIIDKQEDFFIHTMSASNANAFFLRYALRGLNVLADKRSLEQLTYLADKVQKPKAELSSNEKTIIVNTPAFPTYRNVLKKLGARALKDGSYGISSSQALDFKALVDSIPNRIPTIEIAPEVEALFSAPIPGFHGQLKDLKTIPVDELNVVNINSQSWKNLKKSKKTLQEKMNTFGIETLHDLLYHLPKRYIDKSEPQEISDLIDGESATIVGKVTKIAAMARNMGVAFTIQTQVGESIRVNFWRQHWLEAKFHTGDEVLITGKVNFWNGQIQLNGSSIEYSEEAAILPIVPVYKQSESKGITTNFLLKANREMFSRLDTIEPPVYLPNKSVRINYSDAFNQLHFPESIEKHEDALDLLAFYELVYMQLVIQDFRKNETEKSGISAKRSPEKLQSQAIKGLPFELTNAQKKAVKFMNEKMEDKTPASVLLNADTGAGKTLIAQLACIRSVEAGYQAALIAPTEILAQQLYSTFEKLLSQFNNNINLSYLSGALKVSQKKSVSAGLKNGTVDIVVGTHSVLSESVEYKNLGFVCFDEQQKFGAEQRTSILNKREDGKLPDFLMQSATPIPRSTAQVFYGDMDMLELDEKPAGRLPIKTEWIEQDPQELLSQPIHKIWEDIQEEVNNGNQIFIITPMVNDSDKVDAASVKKTFETLSKGSLNNLNVGFAHGQMKPADQKEAMEAFRNKDYDVLIASTVVEVGVDIPDATRMIVLSADRLGASSLHQIRGRIGRNDKESICYLVSSGKTDNARKRLQALVDSENGFDIAKVDLEIRGEGTMFSTSQSGDSSMRFASILSHQHLIEDAAIEAKAILDSQFGKLALRDAKEMFNHNERLI